MAAKWIEALTGSLEQKKQYKYDLARLEALPEPYRGSALALHRYFMYSGAVLDGDALSTMFTDFADLFETAVADATPLRSLIGEDPVEFAEDFSRSYRGREWIDKERARLRQAVIDAEGRA